jgi:hypothetical protein
MEKALDASLSQAHRSERIKRMSRLTKRSLIDLRPDVLEQPRGRTVARSNSALRNGPRTLAVEGTGPHFALAGGVATRKGVHICVPGSTVMEAAREMRERGDSFCLVLNSEGDVLGRLRQKQLDPDSDAAVTGSSDGA